MNRAFGPSAEWLRLFGEMATGLLEMPQRRGISILSTGLLGSRP
jgi:hypothetical protein